MKKLIYILLSIILTLNFSATTSSSESGIEETKIEEFILCRNCGSDISDSHYLKQKPSPKSRFSFNDTLFGKEKVLVQVISSPLSFDVPLITTESADCEGVGDWAWDKSWFPGYMWKPCVCPQCGTHLGWHFEPMTPLDPKTRPFFGLVLSYIIGESFADSLIELPKVESDL